MSTLPHVAGRVWRALFRHPCGAAPNDAARRRLGWVRAGFVLGFLAVAARLIQLHAFPEPRLLDPEDVKSAAQVGRFELRVPRGDIRDRNGRLLATDRNVGSLWADPTAIEDKTRAAQRLSACLHLDEAQVYERLTRTRANGELYRFVYVKRWLSEAEEAFYPQLRAIAEEGLSLRREPVRFYPEGPLAAHVLGFANREGVGCEGVELACDRYLRSIPGRVWSRVDAKRRLLPSMTLERIDPEGGATVHLTLDTAIQAALERELDAALERTEASRAMGLLTDPRTGAILALACRPAFDPNHYSDYDLGLHKNRAVTDMFEPGSCFKIVTAAAALEHGLVTKETLIDCEGGSFNPYGHRIRDTHPMDIAPFWECYAESSNIALIKIAAMLGEERLEHWIRRFGFGRRACPDLRGEIAGLFRPRSRWNGYSMGALPIGQEVGVTMTQLARAYGALANGGYMMDLHVVQRVTDRDGQVLFEPEPSEPKRIMAPATAALMQDLSHLVVTQGTGTAANIPEFRAGGKTGTAQIAGPGGVGYLPGKYTAVFAGFAPIAAPRVCAVIIVQEPGIRLHYGGHCCGPVFKAVVREALITLNCPPDPVKQEIDPKALFTMDELEPEGVEAYFAATANAPGADAEEAAPEGPVLPSFEGMTMLEARAALDELGLAWDFRGAGRVVQQEPPEGTLLAHVTSCRLVFSSRRPDYRYDAQSVGTEAGSEAAGAA